ncbi:MAG: glycoside hydrolase family 3 C-terminal domain-containing protein, partial [Agathobacter sp.]|nr:glycoside hydrolase family 3 C-terminal domain-containing protein [Agathobacter sp.]
MKLRTKAKWTDAITALETKNKALSYQAATEGIVLLENKDVLPMPAGKIALYGAGAGKTIKGGSGSGEVIERHAVSIREGLEDRGFEILTNDWLDRYEELWAKGREEFIAGMRKKLRKFNTEMLAEMMAAEYRYPHGDAIRADDLSDDTDYCIYVVSRQSGEGSDRRKKDYMISKVERDHLEACTAHYKHVILVINTGASFDVSFVEEFENIDAVVFFCQLGQEGGYALADVLTGKITPSGKLAATWANSYKDVPFGKEYSFIGNDLNHAEYREGIYVGYRYYDSFNVTPRYAFGHGLSYTDFEVQTTSVKVDGTKVHVSVSVKNIGDTYAGKETVQLYVSSPAGKLEKEYQSLAAFAKTDVLKPGESQDLELSFSMEYIASYDEETASMILEAGDYILRVGNSSRNTEVGGVATLSKTVVISKHSNLCVSEKPIQTLHRAIETIQVPDVEKVILDVNAFHTEVMDYAKGDEAFEPKVEAMLNKLG